MVSSLRKMDITVSAEKRERKETLFVKTTAVPAVSD